MNNLYALAGSCLPTLLLFCLCSMVVASEPTPGLAQQWARGWAETMTVNREISVETVKQGYGTLQYGVSMWENSGLRVGGNDYPDGLGTHADSELRIVSKNALTRFRAVAGIDQNPGTLKKGGIPLRMLFSVEVGGKELWRSPEMTVHSKGAEVDVALPPGAKQVTLKAWAVFGNVLDYGHVDWAAAAVDVANGTHVRLGTPGPKQLLPFSFCYKGRSSGELLPTWEFKRSSTTTADGTAVHQLTWTDPATALQCRMDLKSYQNHAALEWVLHFKNTGSTNTPPIEGVLPLDWEWDQSFGRMNVCRSFGSDSRISDFKYQVDELMHGDDVRMRAGNEGRSSQRWLPYFNVDLDNAYGVITAIGWTGQWCAHVEYAGRWKVKAQAGMEKTHFILLPGEEVRTPSIAQLYWTGDRIEGHNAFRRFVLDRHSPHLDGKPITGPFCLGNWGGQSTASMLKYLADIKERKQYFPQEYFWVDAGWYGNGTDPAALESDSDWYKHNGDWQPNPVIHPKGFRPVADAARAAGMKFLLWVEPERAVRGTPWPRQHPDWFLDVADPNDPADVDKHDQLLLNLGDPVARNGAIELISGMITEYQMGVYRQDFNTAPLTAWRLHDAPDRQGVTEMHYIAGLYEFLDALLKRHPGLIIDNCASGGRRLDLEMVSRGVALWRSDWQCVPSRDLALGGQIQGIGISYWLPLHGTSSGAPPSRESYTLRSNMGPSFGFGPAVKLGSDDEKQYPWDWYMRMCADYLRARPLFTGDYYPLAESVQPESQMEWAAYQMNRPDLGEGFVMAFRRKDAGDNARNFKLRGLDGSARYAIENGDAQTKTIVTGKELMDGLQISLPRPQSSALIFYKKV